MRRSHTSEGDTQAAVNLTPMLDMAFILLIFFIVTASFTREQGLPLERPSAASAVALDKAPVIVSIDRRGASQVDDRPVQAPAPFALEDVDKSTIIIEANSGRRGGSVR